MPAGTVPLQGRVCCITTAVELKLKIEMHQFAFERQASNDIQVPSPTLISIAGATITPPHFRHRQEPRLLGRAQWTRF